MLADLPTACNTGAKRNSGHVINWTGYKLHIDSADGDIPISYLLTSVSVNHRYFAIPLASIKAGRVISLYDLVNSGYDDAGDLGLKCRPTLEHALSSMLNAPRLQRAHLRRNRLDRALVTSHQKPSVIMIEPQQERSRRQDSYCGRTV